MLQVVAPSADHVATGATALKGQADRRPHDRQQLMRRCGRQCRGQGNVLVTRVRQTAKPLVDVGQQVLPRARTAQERCRSAGHLTAAQRAHLDTQLKEARAAHQRSAHQSRRLTTGTPLTPCNIVHAYDLTMAPRLKGQSNCPAQFGQTPGLIAAMAAGFMFACHLPVGHPGDGSAVLPLVDQGPHAILRVAERRPPVSHSLAGDRALTDTSLREALQARGLLTVGLPRTIEPMMPSPTPEEVLPILNQSGLNRPRTPHQVHMACAGGYSRPVGESFLENLRCRGAAHLRDKGPRGAMVHMGMTIMAHHAATLVRLQQNRLSKRAQKLRRWLGLKSSHANQCHVSKN